jgi:hypothetical protein
MGRRLLLEIPHVLEAGHFDKVLEAMKHSRGLRQVATLLTAKCRISSPNIHFIVRFPAPSGGGWHRRA